MLEATPAEAKRIRRAWAKVKEDMLPRDEKEPEIGQVRMFGVLWEVRERA